MKVLVISRDGSCAPIAHHFQRKDGQEVKLHIVKPEYRKDCYEGLVDKVDDFRKAKDWCDWIYFGENKLVDVWKEVMKWGKPVYGGSEAGQNLEADRVGAHKLMKSLGMKCPESLGVKTVDEAVKHLEEHQEPHVLKFVGGTTDSDSVFLGEYDDNRDLILLARNLEKSRVKWDNIEIETFIPGIEAGVSGYFDGTKFAPGIEVNFQMKRFCAGEQGNGIGFLTGEMGTVIRYVGEDNALFQKTLAKMVPYLQKAGYRGEIDVGAIVDEKGDPWFIEHTPRTGYPDCVIRLPLQVTPLSQLCFQVASGDVKENKTLSGWAVGVVVVTPGFPKTDMADKLSTGLPVIGYKGNEDACHLFGVKKGEGGLEVCHHSDGYPLVVVASGPTLESAQRRAYWTLARANEKRVCVPKSWYREDIGRRVIENKEEIIELGILTEREWDS